MVNEIINGINIQIHAGNYLMDVSKIKLYDGDYTFNWMEWYYFKMMNVLSIAFCVMVGCELTQKYVWQQECLKTETRNAQMQEKCKDNQNNKNNSNNVNGALYFNQCVVKYDSINRLFNGLNMFLIRANYITFTVFYTDVQWTNIFRINGIDAAECIDEKLDRISSEIANNIAVSKLLLISVLAFRITAHNYLFITRCELFLKLTLSFICLLLLDYVTQLFIKLLVIDTIVIVHIIEILCLHQLQALFVQIVDIVDRIIPNVTHNIVIEFFEHDTAAPIVTTGNCVEREGDIAAPGPQATVTATIAAIMGTGSDNGIAKDGFEYGAGAVTTRIHFVNSGLFEHTLQSSDEVLFAARLNGLTLKVKKKVVDDCCIIKQLLEMKEFDCFVFIFLFLFVCLDVMSFVFAVFFLLIMFCFLFVIFVLNFFIVFLLYLDGNDNIGTL